MKHFLMVIPLVLSTVFTLGYAEALPAKQVGTLNRIPLLPLHLAEKKGQWLQAEDFEDIQAQFKKSPDPDHKPIILKYDSRNSGKVVGLGDKVMGRSELDFKYEAVFSSTIHNNESRCVFYQVKAISGREDVSSELRLSPKETVQDQTTNKTKEKNKFKPVLTDTWTYNQKEEVPKIWEEPGIFPLSFSLTSKGRELKVLCATKKHVNTSGHYDGRVAFTSYALLLNSYGVDLKKNGRNFKFYRTETQETSVSAKPAVLPKTAQQ